MNDADLAGRLRLGEDSTLVFKSVLLTGDRVTDPDRRDFADKLAAMANGRGGTVVLGVDDKTRQVQGIPRILVGPLPGADRSRVHAPDGPAWRRGADHPYRM